MKKFVSIITLCALILSFTACASDSGGESTEQPAEKKVTNVTQTTAPTATQKEVILKGKQNPNSKTYTGLEPLEPAKFTIKDPENSAGLSEKGIGYGFGIAKDGKPHEISVENQKHFNKYGALALDTVSEKKVLYLTFDCGYENGYTSKILDVLREKKVPAAFFVTLPYLKQAPEVAATMIRDGHIVGNHSNTHPVFPKISRTKMVQEIFECDSYLREHFGYSAPFFRFPTGEYSDSSLDLVQSLGYTSVFWSLAYGDYDTKNQHGRQYAFDTVTKRLHPGAVILLHAVSSDNAAALGDIIDYARNEGYTFLPLTSYNAPASK